jgi:hypothetical protein
MIGLPDALHEPRSAWFGPPLTELRSLLGNHFDPLTRWCGNLAAVQEATTEHHQQKWWSAALGRTAMTALLDLSSPRDQSRLLEQANGVGHAFMSVPPNNALHFSFPSDSYRLGLKWWLGVSLFGETDPAACPGCSAEVDLFGDHLLCCPRNDFQKRHVAVQEVLADLLQAAGQPFTREVVVPSMDASELRPADLLLRAWSAGRDTAVDLTISHGWQVSERAATRERWRSFLRKKEEAKHAKYDLPCSRANWAFRAMAFGTWGGQGPEAAKLLARFTKRAAGWQDGDLRASLMETCRLSVGVAVMRQVWRMLELKNFL